MSSRKLELAVVKKLLPKSHTTLLTQDFLDRIEASVSDSIIAEQFKENFVTYANVLRGGKYSMEDYVNAIKYISFKLLGYTNKDAYISTFPERYAKLVKNNQHVDAFVQAYNRGKIVNQIYEQTMVPTYILNAPLHQEALSELAKMIRDPNVRGMTKVKACETILNYTKPPEVAKAEITIGMEQQDTISELREVTEGLASLLQQSITDGNWSLKEIAEKPIIDIKPVEIEAEIEEEVVNG